MFFFLHMFGATAGIHLSYFMHIFLSAGVSACSVGILLSSVDVRMHDVWGSNPFLILESLAGSFNVMVTI